MNTFFNRLSFSVIIKKRIWIFLFLYAAWVAILAPSTVECGDLFTGQIRFKPHVDNLMPQDGFLNEVVDEIPFKPFGMGNTPQIPQLSGESRTEDGSGSVELFLPSSSFAEDMGKPARNNCDNGTSNESDDSFFHVIIAFTLGYSLTVFIIGLCVRHYDRLKYRITQR